MSGNSIHIFFKSQGGVIFIKYELRTVKYPVMMRIPTITRRMPPPIWRKCVHFPNLRNRLKNELLANAVNKKGIAKPKE